MPDAGRNSASANTAAVALLLDSRSSMTSSKTNQPASGLDSYRWWCPWYGDCCAWSLRELKSPLFWRDCVSEFLVTAIIMIYVGLVMITNNPAAYVPTTTHFGVFAAFIVYCLIEGWGPYSGAHMNPAATFCFFLAGRISFARALLYIIVQTAGCVVGSGIAYGMTPAARFTQEGGAFHAFDPANAGLTLPQAVAIEGTLAFNLVFIALNVFDPHGWRPLPASMPTLAVAFTLASGIMAAGTHTAGLANPLIALGPAVLARDFNNHWIYWAGPFIGGPLAVIVYRVFNAIKLRWETKPVSALCEKTPSCEDMEARCSVSRDELIQLVDNIIKKQTEARGL